MSLDNYFLKLNNIKILELESNASNEKLLFAYKNSKVGYFEYHVLKQEMYLSSFMLDICGLGSMEDLTLFDLISHALTKNDQFRLLDLIKDLINGESSLEGTLAFKINNKVSWFTFNVNLLNEVFVGTMSNVDAIITLEENVKDESNKLDKVIKSLPIPIYYYDYLGNNLFSNRKFKEDRSHLNKIIEKYINGEKNVLERYDWITFFDVKAYDRELMKFEIHYEMHLKKYINVIHRVILEGDILESGILFLHEDASDIHVDDRQITKILKANELIIEIKDLIDHVNDLNSMYDYLLSKIHTVIPSAKRACIIKLDKNNNMFITASYGFSDEYVNDLKLPFEKSFANSSLRGEFGKSVVLNDIQDKYGKIYPDINSNQHGFIFESNMTAPLVINGALYGLLSVDSDKNNVFDDVDLNLFDYLKLQIERAIVKFKKLSRVKKNSILDPLTGIFNRRHLLDLFEQFCEDAIQMNKTFTLVLFDLDKLKSINDNYGHVTGDKVIKQFAFVATSEIRKIDVIARIGGDEFVGLFWDIDSEVLTEKINRWKESFEIHPIKHEKKEVITEFSYGLSVFPNDGKDFEDMLNKSDKNMYLQKRGKEDE